MKIILTTILLICMCLWASIAWSDIIYVPGDYPTIQEGIDAAVDGDIVLVADGTYTGEGNKNLDFKGKAITVQSENGSDSCIIDCEEDGQGFYFHSGEGINLLVSGFTITNGFADRGGAIYCDHNSSPTITNCAISGNTTFEYGGGVACFDSSSPIITNCTISGNKGDYGGGLTCYYSSPTIINCTIRGNTAKVWGGGGIYCYDSSPTITNCTISNNKAVMEGGGIDCYYGSSPTITNCTISGNTTYYSGVDSGGGMFCLYSSLTITNCTISGNAATYGGGIVCYESSPTIANCTISGNKAVVEGGGVGCFSSSSPTITNCTITNNTANGGGGICCYRSFPTITNCTITGNAATSGGGIYCYYYSFPTITNCILWDDSIDEIYVFLSIPVVIYSDIQGGYQGKGNIDADPMFVGDGDYHLTASSPCIDAGTNNAPDLPDTDFEGDIRIMDGDKDGIAIVDMGVDECRGAATKGSINGRVINLAGNPITEALIIAINADTKDKYQAFTDRNGDYEISSLPPGMYWVSCTRIGYEPGLKEVEVIAGKETTVNFRLIRKL